MAGRRGGREDHRGRSHWHCSSCGDPVLALVMRLMMIMMMGVGRVEGVGRRRLCEEITLVESQGICGQIGEGIG